MSAQTSKFLSYVLRHKPDSIGLTLDTQGWADIAELIDKTNAAGQSLDLATLQAVAAESDKKRFAISEDGKRIRAAQGHSVTVDLGHAAVEPPPVLYHGTATRFLDSIREKGLLAGNRQQVHLSSDADTARKVGERHGKPAILTIDSGRMFRDGIRFFRADNSVWLTDAVPATYIAFDP